MTTFKLKSITQVVDLFKILDVTSVKPEVAIYDIQRMHLKHVNKKDFSTIIYTVDSNNGKVRIIVKFRNNDFYETNISTEVEVVTEETATKLTNLSK